jgi:hypothetical protein
MVRKKTLRLLFYDYPLRLLLTSISYRAKARKRAAAVAANSSAPPAALLLLDCPAGWMVPG